MFASNATRSFAFISAACLFCVGCHRCPTPDGVSMCFLSAAPACVLPSMLCGTLCRSAPKTGTFFVLGVTWWVRDVQRESNWLSTVCRRPKAHGAGGAQWRPLWPQGRLPVWQLDFLNPAGYGRLTPGLCTSEGLFFTFCRLSPEGLNQLLFWCAKNTLLLRNLFKSFPHYRWKLFLLSPRCLRFLSGFRVIYYLRVQNSSLFHLFSLLITWSKLSFVLVSGTFQKQLWKYSGLFLLSGK